MRNLRDKLIGGAAGLALGVGCTVAGTSIATDEQDDRASAKIDEAVAALEDAKAILAEPDPTPTSTPTPTPTTPPGDVHGLTFPTPETTGPRHSNLTASGSITTTANGQVIEDKVITGRLTIRHSNVVVRDVIIKGTTTYMLYVDDLNGVKPSNVRVEYVEIDGALAAENDIPIYLVGSAGTVIDHAHVHNVGRSSRLANDGTIQNSYIFSNRTGDSGAHRGAVGINGGDNNVIFNNVLRCEGTGCSAAIPNYGDFSPVTNLRIEHNLLATTGSYCAYGGSLDSKPYPDGSNIDFVNNHFSREFFPTCGRYGPIAGYEEGVRGNDWTGNVWHESGEPLN